MTAIDRADVYALLTDGRAVRLRSVVPGDWQAVHDFAATLGPDSVYRRFFGAPRSPGAQLADLICAPQPEHGPPTHGGLIALLEGTVVGLAEWHREKLSDQAEIAFAVSDALHGHGVATLLAEHLMLSAERAGLRRLIAITQGENRNMLGVFVALGVPVDRDWEGGLCTLGIDLDLDSAARAALLDASAKREGRAGEASLRALFRPASIALLGDGPGQEPEHGPVTDPEGFSGTLYRGGPRGEELSPDARPELAVVTSPPEDAVAAARRCAQLGVRALIVTATGFTRTGGRELLRVCHEAGMRLIGPGSLGVAAPHAHGDFGGFSALLSARPPRPGPAGVAVQSGGVGLALLSHLDRLGVGVSTFAAVGEKYDVSANDLLLHWQQDSDTKFGLLHVESFGNPRKFALTARRLSRIIPLFAVDPEQSPSQARTALYAQAGIIALPSLGELVNAAALAGHQPAPRGRRVAVLGNTHGMVSLAVQACIKAGLEIARAQDLTPNADASAMRAAIAAVFADNGSHGAGIATESIADAGSGSAADTDADSPQSLLLALAPTSTELGDVSHVLDAVPADVPVIAVLTDQPESVAVRAIPSDAIRAAQQPGPDLNDPALVVSAEWLGRGIPCYNDAAAAAGALAARVHAVETAQRPPDSDAPPAGTHVAAARAVVDARMAAEPDGGELGSAEAGALFTALGIVEAKSPPSQDRRTATVTAWQDPVFGPVVTAVSDGARQSVTMLAPLDALTAEKLATRVTEGPVRMLADLFARVSALVNACPELASARLECAFDDKDCVITEAEIELAPALSQNPYLRRLRHAPVE